MKKNSSSKNQKKAVKEFGEEKLFAMAAVQGEGMGRVTIGLDLGDRTSCWCALSAEGEVIARGEVISAKQPLEHFFSRIPKSLAALEVAVIPHG